MRRVNLSLSNTLKALVLSAALISAAAGAAPIFSGAAADAAGSAVGISQAGAVANAPLFSHMGMNGGYQYSVAFLGEDNSILIGRYSKGPWSKNEFLRAWQDTGGTKDFVPTVETITGLPEPSTLGLLVLSAVAFGVLLRRRQVKLTR